MSSTYMPCTFFDEPIITSHGVIFGLETNGNFISGNLPPVIQAAYIRNNQVPYMPFTNINHNSPSYVTDKQRMEAFNRIAKYNLPAIASDSKMTLTFNKHNSSSSVSSVSSVSSPESKPISREQEIELEQTIIKETGLNPMLCKTHAEYSETTKQIKDIVKNSFAKGLDNAIVEYNDSISSKVYAPKPEYATPVDKPSYVTNSNTPSISLSSIQNRLKLLKRSHIYSNVDNSSDTDSDISSSASGSSIASSASSASSATSDSGSYDSSDSGSYDSDSGSDTVSVSTKDSDSMSMMSDDNDESHITHIGCLINYVTKDGKRNYIMGMTSSNTYSIVTQKVFVNVDTKESCISTLAKMLNNHFPLMKVPINDKTYYTDKKISGNTYRIYQIYVHEFDMSENNKKVKFLKLAGMDIGFTDFKLIPTDNTTNKHILKGELTTNLNQKIKIDYTTKNIFIN